MAKMGRPTAFDAEKAKIITDTIAEGNYLETAAAFAGLSVSTVRDWIRQGARGASQELADFSAAVIKADAQAEIEDNRTIGNAAKTQWQAAAWRQERKRYTRWGRKDHLQMDGMMDLNHTVLSKLSDAELQQAQDAFVIRNAERIERLKKEAEERLMLEAPEDKEDE